MTIPSNRVGRSMACMARVGIKLTNTNKHANPTKAYEGGEGVLESVRQQASRIWKAVTTPTIGRRHTHNKSTWKIEGMTSLHGKRSTVTVTVTVTVTRSFSHDHHHLNRTRTPAPFASRRVPRFHHTSTSTLRNPLRSHPPACCTVAPETATAMTPALPVNLPLA